MLYINIGPGSKRTAVIIMAHRTTGYRRLRGIGYYIIRYIVGYAMMRMAVKVGAVTRGTVTAADEHTAELQSHCKIVSVRWL